MTTYHKREMLFLFGAVLVGLLVRLPGVWWGSNFPSGWYGHHPDEYTHALHAQLKINHRQPKNTPESSIIGLHDPWSAGYSVTPYPVALAMHVALPHITSRILSGTVLDPPPKPSSIIPSGRAVVVFYGVATIIVVYLLAKCLFSVPGVAILAAWLMALSGLHVTQSHFFLSDVPALFWFLLGVVFLWRDMAGKQETKSISLAIAALCFGVAFGIKLFFAGILSLGLVAILREGRVWRLTLVTVFFLFGMFAINAGMFTPVDFYNTAFRGIADPFEFSKVASFFLYIVQLPSLVSLPIFIASFIGFFLLLGKYFHLENTELKLRIALVIILPMILHGFLVIFVLDPFPRHILPYMPWLTLFAAWALVRFSSFLKKERNVPVIAIFAPLFLYLALFIYDGEKGFIDEPRNKAEQWLHENVKKGKSVWWYYHTPKGYKPANFPDVRPDVIVEEMHHANHYLSGLGLKDSMPRDYRYIFDSNSQKLVDEFQALFTKKSEYRIAARFGENYFMPEYVLTDRIIGNRSRNYLAEVVIFVRDQRKD